MYGAWSIQTARLRADLLECQNQQLEANEAARAAQDKIRDDAREASNKVGERLRQEAADRAKDLQKEIVDLRAITARLNAPRPPITVTAMSEPPIVITPPVASCALDRGVLDELQAFLNRGRE
jgi:type IV secretory pathway VirB10-like protein